MYSHLTKKSGYVQMKQWEGNANMVVIVISLKTHHTQFPMNLGYILSGKY